MPPASEQTQSVWATTASLPQRASLTADNHAEVCVIGAGIAGLSAAYLLASAGKSVIILDDGPVGGGQTQRTTAHLSNALDDRYFELERVHGAVTARLAAESHTAAIHRIEMIVREENIECDFQRLDGYLFVPPGELTDILEREQQAANRAGLSDVVIMARAPLPSFDTGRALRFPQQGQFHPIKYLTGLAAAIERRGGRIFTNSHVSHIDSKGPTTVVIKDGPVVTADAVVVATNSTARL